MSAQKPDPKDVLSQPIEGDFQFESTERIKAQIEITKVNLAVLEGRLQLAEQLLLLERINEALKKLMESVANEEWIITELKEKKEVLVKEYDDVVEQWTAHHSNFYSKETGRT